MHSQAEADFTQAVTKLIFEKKFSTLGELWKKLDSYAQIQIVAYIAHYTRPELERAALEHRRRKGALIKRALEKQIAALRKAFKERVVFEEIKYPETGRALVALGDSFWPLDSGPLSTILSTEILRLENLLGIVKSVFNEKRFGIGGKHYWLILAQEFVRSWSSQQLEEVLDLTPLNLADLIDAVSGPMGREGNDFTDPNNIRKALANFQENPSNEVFCNLIPGKFKLKLPF